MTSQSELAYQQIKKMIFHMELLPGDRVSELQIATKLSISRTPIHDALRRLEGEGLLRLERNRGATVICFSEDEVREIGTLIQISKYTDVEHSLLQINHHKPIVAAIRKGNIADIRRLCCLHVQNYYQINPYILSCYSPEV